jgi:erythromycin esterase-like protein
MRPVAWAAAATRGTCLAALPSQGNRTRHPLRETRTLPEVDERVLVELIRRRADLPSATERRYDPLLPFVRGARFVLLGEASHGTHEFYRHRLEITKRLIVEHGFTAVAVEADWPHAYRVNHYVRGAGEDANAIAALAGFQRFPTWMWRNTDVVAFIEWLRDHNLGLPSGASAVGFYGLDLYSLHDSMGAVLDYLLTVDPEAARRARQRYACFDHFGDDTQAYGYAAALGLSRSCEREVVRQLVDLRQRASHYAAHDGPTARDDFFQAEQNARLVRNAEEYYRTMFLGSVSSWNLRDRHMKETLDALVAHLGGRRGDAKVVVWAHNSHLGDARATGMGTRGELNLGQLVRQQAGTDAVLVGFTTDHGTVTAASDWDAPAERKVVRRALPESYEAIFHRVGLPSFLLAMRGDDALAHALADNRLERAIGVVYRPETERASHYFPAILSRQFDAVVHFDETRAVEPLERTAGWNTGEVPETYPTGM